MDIKMKYYTKLFLKSELFYTKFYLPPICLAEYIARENYIEKFETQENAAEIVNQEYISHCNNYFKKNILFYKELSNCILDINGLFKPLDDSIFFKLRYYGTKFLDIVNESTNFFIEERKKFKEKNYDDAIVTLSQFQFHDSSAVFQYKDGVLRIIYDSGCYEKIFEFYGVDNWKENKFMKKNPILIIEELYEEPQNVFTYNTLWYHDNIEKKNHSELSITFTKVVQIK